LRPRAPKHIFVEPGHFESPLDRLSRSADCQGAIALAGDWNHPTVDFRRKRAVGSQFRLARGLAPLQSGEVEEGKFDRALDLECAVTAQEDDRCMGVDARNVRTGHRGRSEKRFDVVLHALFPPCRFAPEG
jgi:hypothetical protein